jgi:ATP adenylyltransferase/5',5'''-P-1,P-4-tetraphosphate phosphorylase II
VVFLALAAIGLTSQDEGTVRGAYLVMAPADWIVLVPSAHASLLSGIALALGTASGLFVTSSSTRPFVRRSLM